MEVIGVMPSTTVRGSYKCPYCPKSWKRLDQEFIDNHVRGKHFEEYIAEQLKAPYDRAKQELGEVLKDNEKLRQDLAAARKPATKKTEYYQAVLYCTNENKVFKAGMPKGVPVENVVCSNCGLRSLKITNNDPSWII